MTTLTVLPDRFRARLARANHRVHQRLVVWVMAWLRRRCPADRGLSGEYLARIDLNIDGATPDEAAERAWCLIRHCAGPVVELVDDQGHWHTVDLERVRSRARGVEQIELDNGLVVEVDRDVVTVFDPYLGVQRSLRPEYGPGTLINLNVDAGPL